MYALDPWLRPVDFWKRRDSISGVNYEDLGPLAEQLRFEGWDAKHLIYNGKNTLAITENDGTIYEFPPNILFDPVNKALLDTRDFKTLAERMSETSI